MENTFTKLKKRYENCERCPDLLENRTQVVFGSGDSKAKVLLIGEAPGANEDKQGVSFCGMSGSVLNELLANVGISRDEVFITNTILCRPPNNRNPKKEEVLNCGDRLNKLVAIMEPKVIVTIGNFATERVIGRKGVTSIRGKVFAHDFGGKQINVVPVVHPASYLYSGRNPELFEKMKSDFKVILDLITKV